MVFHPARALAAPHGVHGRGSWLVYLFSDWLHHLSCAHRRKVLRIQWLARGDLLSCPRFARSVGVCDAAARHFNAYPGVSTAGGRAPTARALVGLFCSLKIMPKEFYCQDCHFTWTNREEPSIGRLWHRFFPGGETS